MQLIAVFKDGDQYCARWGLPMPEHLAIGFGESPVVAMIELLMDIQESHKSGLNKDVDFDGLDYLHNEGLDRALAKVLSGKD